MYEHHCAECGKKFTAKSYKARFCSGTHKSAYHYRRRRLAKIGDNLQDGITHIAVASTGKPDVMVLESAMMAINAVKDTLEMYEAVLSEKLKEARKASRMKSA
jgi:hypothetical protein